MNLRTWILQELVDVSARLQTQVLAVVPPERRAQRPGGGNSINWATFHIARHADLGLAVLSGREPLQIGSSGLGEIEQPGLAGLEAPHVYRYAESVLVASRDFATTLDPDSLERIPDSSATLEAAQVPADEFGWLYEQWAGKQAAFFIRWPLTAHVTSHIGEMIATRNRLGLSPYSRGNG
jgi:hypothetical protein